MHPYSMTGRSLALPLLLASMLFASTAFGVPGTAPVIIDSESQDAGALVPLAPFYSATGLVSSSTDGLGILSSTGQIQYDKPSGAATVRAAFLMAASTGFTNYQIADNEISINPGSGSVPIAWDTSLANAISSFNYLADVTAIVAADLNAAPAGVGNVLVTEGANSLSIDGTALAVVWNDPVATSEQTVALFFGAQDIAGDTFNIGLADPATPSDPDYVLDLCLGISYGFQPTDQVSLIDINGTRMTSSAGGQDDSVDNPAGNGSLITVGGIGDSNANPPDPNAPPTDFDYDDESYDLKPFVNDGDTAIQVDTINPSNDDNIFFACLTVSGAAVVGEGLVLTPISDTNPINTTHTVFGLLQDDNGDPVVGRNVDFQVISGPHAGTNGSDVTDAGGNVEFTYLGTLPGTDEIQASFINSQGQLQFSNIVTKTWEEPVAVELASFLLTSDDGAVTLSWSTSFEDDNLGFHVYRAPVASDDYARVNDDLIQGTDRAAAYRFVDRDVEVGSTYLYRLEALDRSGATQLFDLSAITVARVLPNRLVLHQNNPNPFNPSTAISFELAEAAQVTLRIYDAGGRAVRTLLAGEALGRDAHSFEWDGRDDNGRAVGSGTYLYRLEVGSSVLTRKMVLMK